jgi:hypothetical protein
MLTLVYENSKMHLIQDLQSKLQKTGERLRHFLAAKAPQIKTLLKDLS